MKVKNFLFLIWMLLMAMIFTACSAVKLPPITQAAYNGQTNEVRRFLAQGAIPDTATPQGVTPLFMASLNGHEGVVGVLIDKGADVNAKIKKTFKFEDQTIYEGRTSLMAALSKKHIDIAKILIEQGADVNAVDINGTTPLFLAAALNDEGIVKILIDKGADVNAAILKEYDYKGEPVLMGATPLMAALRMKQNANAALLVAHGADVKARSDDGMDSLMIVAFNGDSQMANFLLSHGADHQTRLTRDHLEKGLLYFAGVNTLMIAAGEGHVEIVNALIKAGADVNAASEEKGITPLFIASGNGHLEVVKALVANGADVKARLTGQFRYGKQILPKGVEALGGASWEGHDEVVQFLIDNGADVNSKEDDFDTNALYMAARQGHIEVVKILIDNGADVYAETKMETAYGAAVHYMHPYVAEYILEAREKVQAELDEDLEE